MQAQAGMYLLEGKGRQVPTGTTRQEGTHRQAGKQA